MGIYIGGNADNNKMHIGSERPFTLADKKNLDAASEAAHTHSNKGALDRITEEKVDAWDGAAADATTNHAELDNLDFRSSGHTGFQAELSETQLTNIDDVPNKENTSNKVTAISSTSTDNEYASAKAVYDFVNGNLGNVETALDNIIAIQESLIGGESA